MIQIIKVEFSTAIVEHVNQFVSNDGGSHSFCIDAIVTYDNLISCGIITTGHLIGAVFTANVSINVDITEMNTVKISLTNTQNRQYIPSFGP